MFPRIIRETTSFKYMTIDLSSQVSWILHFHFLSFSSKFHQQIRSLFLPLSHSFFFFFQHFPFLFMTLFFFSFLFFPWVIPPFHPTISPQIYCNKTIWLHSFLEHFRKGFEKEWLKLIIFRHLKTTISLT